MNGKTSSVCTSSSSPPSSNAPLDLSFQSVKVLSDLKAVKPRRSPGKKPTHRREPESGLFCCTAIKLSHNSISSMQGLWEGLSSLVFRPETIGWLDLSFNGLSKLDEEELVRLTSLKLLYLHGNRVSRLQSVRPLSRLPLLMALTLHGNPVAHIKQYRPSVLALLPQITALDFAQITDYDRRDAAMWARRNLPLTT